jgi:hypothetical protein
MIPTEWKEKIDKGLKNKKITCSALTVTTEEELTRLYDENFTAEEATSIIIDELIDQLR